jgi:signal transduction histidine kinase
LPESFDDLAGMATHTEARSKLYFEYRREVEGEPLTRALRRAVVVLFVINTAFILVDWTVYPEKFWPFLPVRISLDLVLGAIYFWSSKRHPVSSSFATSFAGGAMLFAVVLGTGGASSDYYVGLVLLFIGIGVLAPLSAKQGAVAIGTLFSIYVVMPLMRENSAPIDTSALNIFFLTAAAFVGLMSCAYLDRMRFGDFRQRRELEWASEELKELDREKSRFTANMHHELRTPLTLMLAPIDAFLAGDFGEIKGEQTRYLETMQSNGQRLLKLINSLLDLAKIEGKQLRIHRRRMVVQELVHEIVSGARPLSEQKGILIETSGLNGLPEIFADTDAIEKIFVNLVGNALKFSEGRGEIQITGEELSDGNVKIVVSDDGIGLETDQAERIFDRFAQVDSSATRRHEGTGIGLSLAKELAELHGGRIWAESAGLGKGTQIHLVLPKGEPDGDEGEDVICTSQGESVNLKGSRAAVKMEFGVPPGATRDLRFVELERNIERMRFHSRDDEDLAPTTKRGKDGGEVLVVEDNGDMRQLLRDILIREFSVRTARDGREGLAMAREKNPDLILTDVMMPEMSGTQLCRAVKNDPSMRSIPVVLLTSKAERDMKIQALELGADDYVTKPFHPRELLARVRSLVRLHGLQGELSTKNALLESANEELESTLLELKDASSRLVQAERLAAVGELAAGVAHEVNNPVNFATNALRTLHCYVDDIQTVASAVASVEWCNSRDLELQGAKISALMERVDFEEISRSLYELVGIVTEGLDRTHRLVGDLRDFAAPNRDKDSNVDIRRGIESTIHLIQHSTRGSGIEVITEMDKELPIIRGEPGALNQVFLNLLKNAAEALAENGGHIFVGVHSDESEIRVKIRDDGLGIAGENLEKLFEPFFTTKRAGSGTGLGLSISRRIVMEHGGSIDVETALGEGSSFLVRLPVVQKGGGDGFAT